MVAPNGRVLTSGQRGGLTLNVAWRLHDIGAVADPNRRELSKKCRHATEAALNSLGGTATRAAIKEQALADGSFTAEELAVPGPPSKPQYPRLVDYYLSWSLTWLKQDGVVTDVGRGIWTLQSASEKPAEPQDRQAAYRVY